MMNRRGFMGLLAAGLAAVGIKPALASQPVAKPKQRSKLVPSLTSTHAKDAARIAAGWRKVSEKHIFDTVFRCPASIETIWTIECKNGTKASFCYALPPAGDGYLSHVIENDIFSNRDYVKAWVRVIDHKPRIEVKRVTGNW